jgi:succinate dehydrogenase/fumarate reductase flavoprotein subunit
MSFEFDLLVIGSGPAGQRAAVQAAKVGKRVAIIERQRMVGGVCLQRTLRQLVVGHTLRKDGDEWVVKHRQGVLVPQ